MGVGVGIFPNRFIFCPCFGSTPDMTAKRPFWIWLARGSVLRSVSMFCGLCESGLKHSLCLFLAIVSLSGFARLGAKNLMSGIMGVVGVNFGHFLLFFWYVDSAYQGNLIQKF